MLKIISFNTQHCKNFLTNKIDIDRFAEFLKSTDADVIGLNEMRGEGPREDYTDQTKALADALGYNYYFAKAFDVGGENPYGNAILTRHPITDAKTVKIPDPENGQKFEPRCVLMAKIELPIGEYTFLVTHFGLSEVEQQNASETVLKNIVSEKCVLMGDFNITPKNPIIAEISKRMYDTAKLFECEKFSFPSDAPNIKIDYMFVSGDISVKTADIPAYVLSDHRPYIITIGE